MDYGAIFEEVCEQLGDEPAYTGNHPSDFMTLSPVQQHILVYWIQHVIHFVLIAIMTASSLLLPYTLIKEYARLLMEAGYL